MALADQLQSDLTAAMKARDTASVKTLRMLLAEVRNVAVSPGHSGEVTDDEVMDVLTRQAKRRNEAAEAYRKAGRDDLADAELAELEVIRRYLPEQLDEQALRAIIDEAVAATGASGPGDLGKVMGAVMPKVKGRADGKQVNALVRERLGA
ncbi:MAG TPA: GatB/YqeY domain-containing protein [Egibacteraceae bacterium]